MIRFCDKEVVCVTQDELHRGQLLSFFLRGHMNDVIVVLDERGQYHGQITYPLLLAHQEITEAIDTSYVILDGQVWENGRKFFREYQSIFGESSLLPILNREKQLLCFAYEDVEANREIRMLRELEACENALGFQELYPEYECVTIEGCNELAYFFVEYLRRRNILVNVIGELWSELGICENHAALDYKNYYVYAEGTAQVQKVLGYRLAHSVSAEFECIDVIYEANLNKKIVTNEKGKWGDLIEKLRDEKEIVILGTGEEAQDIYDLFLANGVECCCFARKSGDEKHKLFGKEIISEKEAMKRYEHPVFIECHSKCSSWGLGGVDNYDYYGFLRNEQFFVIRDYIEISKSNLQHVLDGNNVVMVGDVYLCHRLYRYFQNQGNNTIGYFDIGEEKQPHSFAMTEWKKENLPEDALYLLVVPEYITYEREMYEERKSTYVRKLQEYGLVNFTDYFSWQEAFLYIETESNKYTKTELIPKGIVLGNIPGYTGNIFVRDVLYGHPNIRFLEYNFLNTNIYLYCIRLSEVKATEVSSLFLRLYEEEAGTKDIENDFPNREVFQSELERLLMLGDRFTSQELFVMFHIAYAKMCGREVQDINSVLIYWEPHHISRRFIVKSAMWLENRMIHGYTMKLVRNRQIATGSFLRIGREKLKNFMGFILYPYEEDDEEWDNWEQFVIRFEDFKCNPLEIYSGMCEKFGITWRDNLLENVRHNKREDLAKGFDLKPVYNNYEEYLSGFDRMKISLLQSQYQKMYGYPYMNVHEFSRKELQIMFLKDFRCEQQLLGSYSEDMKLDYYVYRNQLATEKLWKLRQQERVELLEANHQ